MQRSGEENSCKSYLFELFDYIFAALKRQFDTIDFKASRRSGLFVLFSLLKAENAS